MELGEKLRQARLEAGLSQRQLCGEEITRNMLSRIENGFARPSMVTLRYLAGKLGKPVGWFLEEDSALSPNLAAIEQARACQAGQDHSGTLAALQGFREPDVLLGRERIMLELTALLALARQAAAEARYPYARELLERSAALVEEAPYCREALLREFLLIKGLLPGEDLQQLCSRLPSLDEELILRAKADPQRAGSCLDAAETRTPQWHLLRGQAYMQEQNWQQAAIHLKQAEAEYPKEAALDLESCFRELGDYKQAYEYACKSRKLGQ